MQSIDMIMNYDKSAIYAPDGALLWAGEHSGRSEAFIKLADVFGNASNTVAGLCDAPARADGNSWINPMVVRDTAESLGFVTRRGNVPGFFTHLPAGAYVERVVQQFNLSYLKALGAHEIEFPVVFDSRPKDIQEMTESYETQGLMFRLDERDQHYRLAYAADPGLFSWLRGKTILSERLPYTIYSPTLALRRHPGGKIGPYTKARQFSLPDIHMISRPDAAYTNLLKVAEANSVALKFWVGDRCAQFIDIAPDFLSHYSSAPEDMARKAGAFTVVNQLTKQPRYYAMRSGMMADAGTGALMTHNIQWDQSNPDRFGIRTDMGESPVIIHASGLAGWKLLSIILGRGLAGDTPKTLPPECVVNPIALVPVREEFTEAAIAQARRLTAKGISARVEPFKRSLGSTVWSLRSVWQPAISVIGAREADSGNLTFAQGHGAVPIGENEYFAQNLDRVQRFCDILSSPDSLLPFFIEPPVRAGKTGRHSRSEDAATL